MRKEQRLKTKGTRDRVLRLLFWERGAILRLAAGVARQKSLPSALSTSSGPGWGPVFCSVLVIRVHAAVLVSELLGGLGLDHLRGRSRLHGRGPLFRHSLLQDAQRLIGRQAGLEVALHPLLGAGRLLPGGLLKSGRLLVLGGNRLGSLGLEAGLRGGLRLKCGRMDGMGLLPQLADFLPRLGSDLGDLLQFLGIKSFFLRHVLELGPNMGIHHG